MHLLRPYLAMRTDWSNFERAFDGQTAGVDVPSAITVNGMNGYGYGSFGGTSDGRGLGERLGMSRLSTMMRELEGLKIGDRASNLGERFNFSNRFGTHSGSG